MTEQEILHEISQCVDAYDDERLSTLVDTLSPQDCTRYKTELSEAYYQIYSVWFYDYLCGKVEMSSPESFFGALINMLSRAEQINPEITHFEDQAQCYEAFADALTNVQARRQNLDKAIAAYHQALRTGPPELNAMLAQTLIQKVCLTGEFTPENLEEVERRLALALRQYSEIGITTALQTAFRILDFSSTEKSRWHGALWLTITELLNTLAINEPYVYLIWSDSLISMLETAPPTITPEYTRILTQQADDLLSDITDLVTNDAQQLNSLGQAFEKAAERAAGDSEAQLKYYHVALDYFRKGHAINPAAWTFPVYAVNVLTAMARLYDQHAEREKIIQTFETGIILFEGVLNGQRDFTLNINWAEFLFEYARMAYAFQAPHLLAAAEQKAALAKALGQGNYDHPYLTLAKIALKSGNIEACLNTLLECRQVFTTPYYTYDWEQVRSDEDFRDIWSLLP